LIATSCVMLLVVLTCSSATIVNSQTSTTTTDMMTVRTWGRGLRVRNLTVISAYYTDMC
jgi:hypothetical protein